MSSGTQPRKPYFWPAIFLTAFLAGAVLWGLWMFNIVQRTRREREERFFVPQSQPAAPNAATNVTNSSSAPAHR